MSRPPSMEADLAACWAEAFAAQIHAWSVQTGAAADDAQTATEAARLLIAAMQDGHVCLPLDGAGRDRAGTRERLLRSGVVAVPPVDTAAPLVLDDEDRLYLHRYYDHERRLARRLVAAARPADPPSREALRWLREAFAASAPAHQADWQQLAAALALRQRLAVISGGPGTGKTTTVVQLLACLLVQQPDCRIALAAPTGKAAARLVEALRLRAAALPAPIRERLPGEASTVHRLLGMRGDGRFAHGPDRPLPIDALVLDEASMLDLALATRLLEAVPAHARIVLLGDKDQLAAVEAGAVFAELSADPRLTDACRSDLAAWCQVPIEAIAPPTPGDGSGSPSALPDSTVWFTRNFRFSAEGGIGRLAADVRSGHAEAALAWLRRGGDEAVRWLDEGGQTLAPAAWDHLVDGYTPYVEAVLRDPQDVAAATAAFGRFRVLAALRAGPRGVEQLNARLEAQLRPRLAGAGRAADPRSPWWVGRPVMVLRNDPVMRLYNGDIGLVLPSAGGGLAVHFPQPDGRFRAVAPVRLPAHETAFAMTVHKSQGSEFDRVFIVLPAQPGRLVTRELLYTALTRARERATLAAPAGVLASAIASPTRRASGLQARLREASRADAAESSP